MRLRRNVQAKNRYWSLWVGLRMMWRLARGSKLGRRVPGNSHRRMRVQPFLIPTDHEPSRKLNIEYGNKVTCHVGVPSCGQRHRNDLLLTCTITNTIINHSLASPPCASSPALFLLPTLPLLYYLSPCVLFPLKPNPVEEDWWKGFIRPVHRPSPRGVVDVKSTTPTHPVDYRVNTLVFT